MLAEYSLGCLAYRVFPTFVFQVWFLSFYAPVMQLVILTCLVSVAVSAKGEEKVGDEEVVHKL